MFAFITKVEQPTAREPLDKRELSRAERKNFGRQRNTSDLFCNLENRQCGHTAVSPPLVPIPLLAVDHILMLWKAFDRAFRAWRSGCTRKRIVPRCSNRIDGAHYPESPAGRSENNPPSGGVGACLPNRRH